MTDVSVVVSPVIGGASGIGRGMGEAFLERGMKVVLADVEAKALDATVAELREAGGEVFGVECDVSSSESVASTSEVYDHRHVCELHEQR